MEINEMTMDQVEEEIRSINFEEEGADLDALEQRMTLLEARKNEIIAQAEARRQELESVASAPITTPVVEERGKNIMEIRESAEYVNAFANYIKSGDDSECRALLTTNVDGGTIAVPSIVEGRIRTAWENEQIMNLVRKTYLKGNVKVGFERSASAASIHTEGGNAVSEEELVLGIVTMVPQSIKKWISVSDEALDLSGEEFLNYIYDELTHQIAKKAADTLVTTISSLSTSASATAVSAQQISAAPAVGTVAKALAKLSDEATNPVVIMNKVTWGDFKDAEASANYGRDIFEGCKVVFNNTLPAYASANANAVYMIVGDLGVGAQANFPNGEEITIKVDDKTLMASDLVKILGREYVGLGCVSCDAFTNVKKPTV